MDGYLQDYVRGHGDGVQVSMCHDPHAWRQPHYEIRLPNGGRCSLTIEELRMLHTLLNEHMDAFECHAATYSHP